MTKLDEALEARLRALPAVHEVLERLASREPAAPRTLLVSEVRRVLAAARARILAGEDARDDIEREVAEGLARLRAPSLRRVINATGVVLHTNLGRAPLPSFEAPAGYVNLEYDLDQGLRGKRDAHIGEMLERLLGAPAIAVNNNAAAVYLALNELAAPGEVIVSRGELIEIGDSFRIPDIMAKSGAVLREIGTTNRTRIEDYRGAVNERTRLILLVHPSNFRIEGFTGKPARAEVAALGRELGIPVYEDLGSGCLLNLSEYGITEPAVRESLRDGIDLVSFSGDKLLGGPQAGLLAGRPDLVARLRRNPMYRALRLDKLILQALAATLRHLLLEEWDEVPALRMIRQPEETIRLRAGRLAGRLPAGSVLVEQAFSVIGGGSTPQQEIPTWVVAVPGRDAMDLEKRLRRGMPPVIARIEADRLLVDLRTVFPEEEDALARALQEALSR